MEARVEPAFNRGPRHAPILRVTGWVRPALTRRPLPLPLCRRPARSRLRRSAIRKQRVPRLGLKPSLGMTKERGMADAALKRRSTRTVSQSVMPSRTKAARVEPAFNRGPRHAPILRVTGWVRPALTRRPLPLPLCRRPARSPQGRRAIKKTQIPPLGLPPRQAQRRRLSGTPVKPSLGMTKRKGTANAGLKARTTRTSP